jgi:hypothetical protein
MLASSPEPLRVLFCGKNHSVLAWVTTCILGITNFIRLNWSSCLGAKPVHIPGNLTVGGNLTVLGFGKARPQRCSGTIYLYSIDAARRGVILGKCKLISIRAF